MDILESIREKEIKSSLYHYMQIGSMAFQNLPDL
jgi:hypothetical protein